MTQGDTAQSGELKRSVGYWQLTLYGTGTILGAGIFVVIGEVLGKSGTLSPLAYLLAAVVAITTALSFAEMAARIPTAAGPIDYLEQAFDRPWLGSAAGWGLTIANIVSGATITTGFVSYLNSFLDVQPWVASAGLCLLLGAISIAGMKQSAWFMTTTTLVGLATLLIILWALRDALLAAPALVVEDLGSFDGAALTGLFAGAFLAMYSFIGFGDMAQTAEEARDVKSTLPKAIVTALVIVLVFYLAIALALVGTQRIEEISAAKAPLVNAAAEQGIPALPLAIASLFVIVNGALTQVIAAARLLMDLGRDGRGAPAFMGRVNDKTDTPVLATLVVVAIVLALALFIPLGSLASATSFVILIVFCGVNLSLIAIKRESQPDDVPDVWRVVPHLGALTCALAVIGQICRWLGVF